MDLQVKIHAGKEVDFSKEVIERLVQENLNSKVDNYLKQFDKKEDAVGILEIKIDKNKKNLFDGVLQATLDGQSFRYSREDYKNMDDLVNHLFDHFKEGLSK